MPIPILPLPRDTNPAVADAIRTIAREAQRGAAPESYGEPTEVIENKLIPDPDNDKIYIYLNGVKKTISLT